MYVHAAAVIADQRFRHESGGFAAAVGHVVHAVFEDLHFVGFLYEAARADADLALASSCNFVVMHFYLETHILQGVAHGGADVLKSVYWGHRKVAPLQTRAMSAIALLISGVRIPCALHGIDFVEAAIDV